VTIIFIILMSSFIYIYKKIWGGSTTPLGHMEVAETTPKGQSEKKHKLGFAPSATSQMEVVSATPKNGLRGGLATPLAKIGLASHPRFYLFIYLIYKRNH
jgi:hypothetical protein